MANLFEPSRFEPPVRLRLVLLLGTLIGAPKMAQADGDLNVSGAVMTSVFSSACKRFGLAVAAASVMAGSAAAATFSVGPVRIHMSSESPTAAIEVRSGDFSKPMLLQATAFGWTIEGDERVLSPDPDLEVSPSVLRLEPGEVRTILLRSSAVDVPRYYRLLVEEVDSVVAGEAQNRLAFRQAFDLPVFVEQPGAEPDVVVTASLHEDSGLVAILENRGQAKAAATALVVEAPEGTASVRHEELVYLLPGSRRRVVVPATEGLALEECRGPKCAEEAGPRLVIEDDRGEVMLRVPIERAHRALASGTP